MNNDVTVVICLFNAENYIKETLQSLVSQSFKNFNLLIIDDCSNDNSVKVVRDFLKFHPDIESELVQFDKNRGTAYLRNYSLYYVRTKYMLFFDADDVAKPQLLHVLLRKIKSDENLIAVSCYSKYVDQNSNNIIGGHYIGPKTEAEFKYKAENGKLILIPNVTLFIRKAAINAGGYRLKGFFPGKVRYEDLSEDLDLWSRMSDFYIDGKVMLTVPEVLFFYRKNTTSLSGSRISLISMQAKIRFIKINLKRRRAGLEEVSFKDYVNSLSIKEKVKNKFIDNSAFYYRTAGFSYVNKKYIPFLCYISLAAVLNPAYLIDKVRNNLVRESRS